MLLYEHISQKPYSCVPACVQMILRRRNLPAPNQSNIGYALGMLLPPTKRGILSIRSHSGRKPESGWGTRIDQSKYSLQNFFKQQRLPLVEKFYPAKYFKTSRQLSSFLAKTVRGKEDALVCFNYPYLYRKDGSWGHVSLVSKVNAEHAVLIDPGRKYKKPRIVSTRQLYDAMKNHSTGGVWVISSSSSQGSLFLGEKYS